MKRFKIKPFLIADILTHHDKKGTGVTDSIDNDI